MAPPGGHQVGTNRRQAFDDGANVSGDVEGRKARHRDNPTAPWYGSRRLSGTNRDTTPRLTPPESPGQRRFHLYLWYV